MKKLISITMSALLALSVQARPHGRGPAPAHYAPPPVMRAAPRYHRPGPWRPLPPPPPPRFEPVVAGVLGIGTALFWPRYVWVEGHYETRTTALPDGTVAVTSVWIPGRYVPVH